jgi:hypothetical protein
VKRLRDGARPVRGKRKTDKGNLEKNHGVSLLAQGGGKRGRDLEMAENGVEFAHCRTAC